MPVGGMFNLSVVSQNSRTPPRPVANNRNWTVQSLQQSIQNRNNRFLVNKVILKKIGSQSVNGAVFKLSNNGSGRRKVLKIVKSPGGVKEAAFQRNMAKLGISPNVHNNIANVRIPRQLASALFSQPPTRANMNNQDRVKINAIIMNNLQQSNANRVMSLQNYLKSIEYSNQQKQKMFNNLGNMVNAMANARIIHGDLHSQNVYVILSRGKPPKLFVIDYGRSQRTGIPTRAMTKEGKTHKLKEHVNDPYYGKMLYTRRGTPYILNESKLNLLQKEYGFTPRTKKTTRFAPY
jgi:hypothetical protein